MLSFIILKVNVGNNKLMQIRHLPTGKSKAIALKYVNIVSHIDKKEEIWPNPMTKVPTPTEMSKGQSDNTNNATKKFD